jgi:hypothetical protein|tara:strand:+ start:358 stop:636 length:279 start_codon:yes stop_codon:yes gene_type:complete
MGWMSRLRKPNPNRKQLLFFTKDQLKENYFAVIRITWFAAGQICAVNEAVVYRDDLEAVAEFSGIVGEALRGGADVSIVCVARAEDVGLEQA